MPLFLEESSFPVPILIVIVVAGAVLVRAIILFSLLFISRHKLKKKPGERHEAFDTSYTQLITDCKQSVERLGNLGKYSDDYQKKYVAKKEQYDKIFNGRAKEVKDSLDSMDALRVQKDWHSLRNNIQDVEQGVKDFRTAVSKFSLELTSLLQDENDAFSSQVAIQEHNRQAREFYEKNKEALAPISDSFQIIFDEADRDFKKFNTLANQAQYKEGLAGLYDVDKALTQLLKIQDKLPLLTASLYSVLPKKTDALLRKNDERIKDGFVISYRHVPERVKEIRLEIQALCSRLQQLDVYGIDERIQAISKQITDREAQFRNEEKAKKEFLSGQDILSSSSYQVEKRFSRARHRLPEYERAYCIDEKYINDRNGLKGVIENVNLLKNRLDSYTGTGRKESYTVIVRVRNERRSGREKAEKTRDNYDAYLKSIKEKSQEAFSSLRTTYKKLKKGELTLRNRNVSSVTSLYQPRFEKLEGRAKERTNLFSVYPIDLNRIFELNNTFQTNSTSLLTEIEKKCKDCQLAETAIVKGNYYRQDYTDSNAGLDRAVSCYNEGDFERAFAEATRVVERRKTDSASASH